MELRRSWFVALGVAALALTVLLALWLSRPQDSGHGRSVQMESSQDDTARLVGLDAPEEELESPESSSVRDAAEGGIAEVGLHVTVRDASGLPVANPSVVLRGQTGILESRESSLGSRSAVVPRSEFPVALECSGPGYQTAEVKVLEPGEGLASRRVAVCLWPDTARQPPTVGGWVVDHRGRRLEGAQVQLRSEGHATRSTRTDARGQFKFGLSPEPSRWDSLQIDPPAGRLLKPRTLRNVRVPSYYRMVQLWLSKDAFGSIEVSAPPPPSEVVADGRQTVAFYLFDEETGFSLGGGGQGKKQTARFRRVAPGRYKIVARVGDVTFAEDDVRVSAGRTERIYLRESAPPVIRGRFDETWRVRPVSIRVIPQAVIQGASTGGYEQFDAAMMAAWELEDAMHLKERIRVGSVANSGTFELQAGEAGDLVLDAIAEDGRVLARVSLARTRHAAETMDLGTLSDPEERRFVSLHLAGDLDVEVLGSVRICVLDRSGVVLRQQVLPRNGVIGLGQLIPGSYALGLYVTDAPGVHRGISPMFHLEVAPSRDPLQIYWVLPPPPSDNAERGR